MIVVMIACNIQMPAVGEGAFDAATLLIGLIVSEVA